NDGLQFVLLLIPGGGEFPAQSVVEGQVRGSTPAVLAVKTHVLAAAVGSRGLSLQETGWCAQHEIGEVESRLAPKELVISVLNVAELFLQLSVMIGAAKRQSMLAHQFAIVIQNLEGILDQYKDAAERAELEAI